MIRRDDPPPPTQVSQRPVQSGDDDLFCLLNAARPSGLTVTGISRRPSKFSTSHLLEELDATLSDGTKLALILKTYGRDALLPDALKARPDFMYETDREIAVYEHLLGRSGLGCPRVFAFTRRRDGGTDRLILERVAAEKLCHVGELELWEAAARWLRHAHLTLAGLPTAQTERVPLLVYDKRFYENWARRASESLVNRADLRDCILPAYRQIIPELADQPRSLIHGEFYPHNILVRPDGRICTIDWELAAWGPALMDLAALTAGSWPASARDRIIAAYRDSAMKTSSMPASQFTRALAACQLHVAVQWLAWSTNWTPPSDHSNDWAAAALQAMQRLT